MAKDFSSQEVKLLLNKHSRRLQELAGASDIQQQYLEKVKTASDNLAMQEVMGILRGVPVEELTKQKKGLKIKLLLDFGYRTVADVYSSTPYRLASIRGISEDAAYTIIKIAKDFAQKTFKEIHIKLSSDKKSKQSTELVKSIYLYKCSSPLVASCNRYISEYKEQIDDLCELVKPGKSALRWLFTTKSTKERVNNAYQKLNEIWQGDYGVQTKSLINELANINSRTATDAWADFVSQSPAYFSILEDVNPGLLGNSDAVYGLPEELAKEIQDQCFFPDGLLCSLRRYQEWGVKYILHQERVLLGDEMGLGKTIQAIATMVSLKNTGATHFVVVCPASVLTNWCREIVKHSKLSVIKIHGNLRLSTLNDWVKHGGVAVTTYETIKHFNIEENFKYSLTVVDEAHYIKNPEAQRTKNTIALCKHSERLLFMTGTALENNVDEMITLIRFLQPKVAEKISRIAFMSAAPQFREKVASVYYRRKRDDVLTELPELIESKEWCTLSREEENIYERSLMSGHYMQARRVSWNVDDLNNSSKARRLLEIIKEAESEGRKILVFSYFLETIRKIYDYLGDRCLNPINGSVSPQRRQEIIDEFNQADAGTVLVSQIQSGGTGLNIQSASVVIICEPQLKPSIENQAISRSYRMGQARNVLVYRLLCENSIDEKITDLLEKKQAIFDAFADKSVAAEKSLDIDDKTFGDIIAKEIERINEKNGIAAASDTKTNNSVYYNTLMQMTYRQIVERLLSKYGKAKYDYFVSENCTTKNRKNSRTEEGLFCHHIDEDKAICLSNDKYAISEPFEYQKADRLVYCNFLEHLLLHIKIAEENVDANEAYALGIGGAVKFLIRQINDFYSGVVHTQEYLTVAAKVIEHDYESYIVMLKYLWNLIKSTPKYSSIKKEDLACNWDGKVVEKILNNID